MGARSRSGAMSPGRCRATPAPGTTLESSSPGGDQAGAIASYRRALEAAPAMLRPLQPWEFADGDGPRRRCAGPVRGGAPLPPADASIHFNLGNALAQEKRVPEAAAQYRQALEMTPAARKPGSTSPTRWSGQATSPGPLMHTPRVQLRRILPTRGSTTETCCAVGSLSRCGEGIREALRLDPGAPDVHNNLGASLPRLAGLPSQAEFEAALRLRPDYAEARDNLGARAALEQAQGHP